MTGCENQGMRGLHIIVINPLNFKLEFTQVFDTYKSSASFENFLSFSPWSNKMKDKIVIAACKDECTDNLSNTVIRWFEDLGSKEIRNLYYRQSFAFISVSSSDGGNKVFEKVSSSNRQPVQLIQIFKINSDVACR